MFIHMLVMADCLGCGIVDPLSPRDCKALSLSLSGFESHVLLTAFVGPHYMHGILPLAPTLMGTAYGPTQHYGDNNRMASEYNMLALLDQLNAAYTLDWSNNDSIFNIINGEDCFLIRLFTLFYLHDF